MVRALGNRHEALEAIDRSEHRFDAAPALPARHAWILWVAGDAHLVLFRHWNDALQEIGDSLPVRVRIDAPGNRQRRILPGVGVDERAVSSAPAPKRRLRPRHADEREVVLHRRDARARGVPDHLADPIELLFAVGFLREQDGGALASRDLVRAERERHHVERDAVRFDALLESRQSLDRPSLVETRRRQTAADVIDAEPGERAKDRVRVAVLRPDLHPRPRRLRRGRALVLSGGHPRRHSRLRQRAGGHAASRKANELSAIHRSLLPQEQALPALPVNRAPRAAAPGPPDGTGGRLPA